MLWNNESVQALIAKLLNDNGSEVAIQRGTVHVIEDEGRVFTDPSTLWQHLTEMDSREGWLMTTQRVVAFFDGDIPNLIHEPILAGEIQRADGSSVHIDFDQRNTWGLRVLRTISDDSGVVVRQEFLVDRDPNRRIIYDVGWSEIPVSTGATGISPIEFRPVAYRFAGFEQAAAQVNKRGQHKS